jgi:hypothetical protein
VKFYKDRRNFPRIPLGSQRDRLQFAWLPVFFPEFNMSVWLERYWVEEEYRMGKRFIRGWFTFAAGWDVMKKVPAEWAKKAPSKKMANSSKYSTSDVIQINERRKRFANN